MKHFKQFGGADEATLKQIGVCLADDRAVAGVLCADNHLGYGHPIGGVVAYRNAISISGVGYDIGCGNLALKTDADITSVKANIGKIMDDVASNVEFGVGSMGNRWKDHPYFESDLWAALPDKSLKDMARQQLGSVGGGNHYVDIFEADDGSVWVGVHFGSRGLGHKIATHFMKLNGAKDGLDAAPCVIDAKSTMGYDYIYNMHLAGGYANAGRSCVAEYVAKNILGANILERVSNHHNFAWQESWNGEDVWVARKGSTPNYPGQVSFVGGSMGDLSFILEGLDNQQNKDALYSTIHGAGRAMSRKKAKAQFTSDEQNDWVNKFGVCLRGGDVDESPMAYKRIGEVLNYHIDTVRIVTTLKPIGVAMAPARVIDPFKD